MNGDKNIIITQSRSSYLQEVSRASDNSRLLWRTVSHLLHPAPRDAWFHGLDTAALPTGFLDFIMDKVRQVKLKSDAGLLE